MNDLTHLFIVVHFCCNFTASLKC